VEGIQGNMLPEYYLDDDLFREERLYNEQMDRFLSENTTILKLIYEYYKKSHSRPKHLPMPRFLDLLNDCDISNPAVGITTRMCKLAYVRSRMYRVEDLSAKEQATQMTFLEFIEASSRVAELVSFPSEEEVADIGFESMCDFLRATQQGTQPVLDRRPSADFSAPKTRPLAWKLKHLTDLYIKVVMEKVGTDDMVQFEKILVKLTTSAAANT